MHQLCPALTWIPGTGHGTWNSLDGSGALGLSAHSDLALLSHWSAFWNLAGWTVPTAHCPDPQCLPSPSQDLAFPLQDASSVLDSASGSKTNLAALGRSPAAPSAPLWGD